MVDDLKKKSIKGVLWSGIEQWTYHGLNGFSFLVFARLLSPSEFGTWSIVVVYMGFAGIPIGFGWREVVIQGKVSPSGLSSIFYLQALSSLAVVVLTLLAAPSLSALLGLPRLTPILQASSIIILCDGLAYIQNYLFHKELNFKMAAMRRLAGMIIGSLIGLGAAWMGAGIWSLLLFHACASLTRMAVLWSASTWRPSGPLHWASVHPLLGLARRYFLAGCIHKFRAQADSVLVGSLLGHVALGYYSFALRICAIFHELISATLSQVVLPLFSLLQQDLPRARRIYFKLVYINCLIGLPAFLGALATAGLFIPLFFSEKWAPVVPVFQFLMLGGVGQTMNYKAGPIFIGLGHSRLVLNLALANCLLSWILLWFGASISLMTVAAFSCTISWLFLFVNEAWLKKILAYTWHDYANHSLPSVAASGLMLITLLITSGLVRNLAPWTQLLLLAGTGALAYAFVVLLWDRKRLLSELQALLGRNPSPEFKNG